jgi:hypothetical protein
VLASGVDIDYRVGPKYISPTQEGQIPSQYMQPNKYFPIALEHLYDHPVSGVTFDELKALFRY